MEIRLVNRISFMADKNPRRHLAPSSLKGFLLSFHQQSLEGLGELRRHIHRTEAVLFSPFISDNAFGTIAMQSLSFRVTFLAVVVLGGLAALPSLTLAQSTKPITLKPVSDEVFQIIAQFYQYDVDTPLQAKVTAREDFSDYTRDKIVFTGLHNSRVPGYLALPKTGARPYPLVLLINGIAGAKTGWFVDDSWPKGGLVSKALLKNHIAILALDAVFHGERTAENDFANPPTAPYAHRDMILQTTVEYRRAMDYLVTRPEIDSGRIGAMGLSMGALITFALASVDARITTAVAGLTPVRLDPELLPVFPQVFAPRLTARSFLMLGGKSDQWYSVEQATQLYQMISVADKEFVLYETGHEPPVAYVEKVTDWFRQRLTVQSISGGSATKRTVGDQNLP
jgi:dienelactone hydrolase